jgi:hypothetical protein
MSLPSIPPPSGDLSDRPDRETKKALDFTAPVADNRILFIDAKIFRYGTDDKAHAASIALSVVLLATSIIVMTIGMFSTNTVWLEKTLTWVGGAFTFVAGVAIGRGGRDAPRDE